MSHETIQSIIHSANVGSLGTIGTEAFPFVSLVTVTATGNRSVAMLLSGLAVHTKNLIDDPRASLLLTKAVDANVDPLTQSRVTLIGRVKRLARDDDSDVRSAFLAKHPSAAMYADFGDFAFYVLDVEDAHLVAGFGRIETVAGDQL